MDGASSAVPAPSPAVDTEAAGGARGSAAGAAPRRRIYAFFAKHKDDTINVHGEAQKVMENLQASPWWQGFELNCFPLPTYDGFRDMLETCAVKNVTVAYFSGHSGLGGTLSFCGNDTASEMEMLGPEFVAPCLADASKRASSLEGGGTVECAAFNTCHTRLLALAVRKRGVLYVIAWRGEVRDSTAAKFALQFFKRLAKSPTDYVGAFEAGRLEVKRCDPAAESQLCFFSDELQVDMAGDEES